MTTEPPPDGIEPESRLSVAGVSPADGASPDPAPPGAAPAVGWATPSATDAARPPSRLTMALLWLVAGVLLVFVAWLRVRVDGGVDAAGSGRAVAYVVGTILGAVALAALLRWVYVRFRRQGDVLRSPWLPITVLLLAGVNIISALGAAGATIGSTPPADPSTAMRVASPYTLAPVDAATLEQVLAVLESEGMTGQTDVRNITGPDGSISRIFAIDAALAADADLQEVADGMTDSSGVTATIERIAGTEVALAITPGGSIATWIEAPLMVSVVSADEAILRDVVEAVLTAD